MSGWEDESCRDMSNKVVTIPIKLGFDFEQKCRQLEESMNELGAEGWKFCASLNEAFLLMREVEE